MTTPQMSCPSGGTFWACTDGSKFVGCCATNPCASTGCATGNIETTSFPASQYGQIPDEQCSAGLFYTCTAGSIPFWGCCKSNPCGGTGCPKSDLAGAFLSNQASGSIDAYVAAYNSSSSALSSASSTASSTTLLTSTTSSGRSTVLSTTSLSSTVSISSVSQTPAFTTASSTPLPTADHNSSSNAGAIAGGVVGGLAVLAALILGIMFLLRRRNKPEAPVAQGQVAQQSLPGGIGPAGEYKKAPDSYVSSAMSSYPGSPRPPYSPGPPSYAQEVKHVSHELPGQQHYEMDSGQMYHPYRPDGVSTPV